MLLAEQYPTLAEQGITSDREIRRVLTSRGYSGRIGANSHRVTEILFSCNGNLRKAEAVIDENYPEAFRRNDGEVPVKSRLREQLYWARTIQDADRALRNDPKRAEREREQQAERERDRAEQAARRAEREAEARAEREAREAQAAREREERRQREAEEAEKRARATRAAKKAELEKNPPVFAMSQTWRLATQSLGRYPYSLLYGPPGTGKTGTAFKALAATAAKAGGRLVNIYITPDTTAAELMGFTAPDDTGAFKFRYGALSIAMKEGWPVLINEIDDVQGDAETALLGVLDDQDIAQYELMNGESVTPKEGFTVVATMNGQPSALRPALADRFPMQFEILEAHPDALATLPVDLRTAAYKSVKATDPHQRHSLRPWLAFARARDEWGYSEEDAAFSVWKDRSTDILNELKMSRGF